MPLITSKQVWTQQPQIPSRISDKFAGYLPFAGNNNLSVANNESIATISPSIYGHGVPVVTPGGVGAYYDDQRSSLVTHNTLTNVYTLFAICYGIRESTERHFLDDDNVESRKFQFRQKSYGIEFIPFDISGTPYFPTISLSDDTILSSTVPRIFVAAVRGHSGGGDVYIGSQKASASFSNIAPLSSSFLVGGFKYPPSLYSFSGPMAILGYAAFASKIPDDVIFDVIRQPWQLFKRQDKRILIPSAGGGDVTIACTPGNATTAGISASVSAATTISGNVGGATTAGVACALPLKVACNVGNATTAGIACSLPVVVQCGVGTATTAGVTAGISLDTSITIACNAGNATAAGVAAGISLDTAITISCNVGTATTAGVTAGISSATTITCNAGTATTAGVSATFPQSLSCNVGNATTTGITAQVEIAGQIVIGCNAGTATTAGVSANISSAFVLTCNAGTATTLGATAYFPQSLQCSPGNAIAVGIDATFTVAGPTTIVCNVGNATASGISFSFGGTLVDAPNGSGPAIIIPRGTRPPNIGGIRI